MTRTFLTSDTHFGHLGVCKFVCEDGVTKVRPWNNPEEMDEEMVRLWNDTVGPKDKVYHLGDVVINRKALSILDRLNGDKVLIKGNHDIFKLEEYMKYFRDIRAYHVTNRIVMSHIPIHSESRGRFKVNIHGHLHQNVVKINGKPDPFYFNVCVERTGYKPILYDDVLKKIEEIQMPSYTNLVE